MQCNSSNPQRCRVFFIKLINIYREILSQCRGFEKYTASKVYRLLNNVFFLGGVGEELANFQKLGVTKFLPPQCRGNIYLEWLQVCAQGYTCFVLNIFLKPQEGIGFYIFSQIFTSLKADRGIRVCYDLFSRGFLFAFYKPFCFGICSSTKKPRKDFRTWQDFDKKKANCPP